MQIPTLFMTADQAALLCLDGVALGEAGPAQPISLPVAPDGVYYLSAQALEKNYMNITRRLIFDDGRMKEAPDSIFTRIWPGGMHEISVKMPAVPQMNSYQPAMSLAVRRLGSMTVTLFREQGIHLAIDQGEELVFSHTIAQGEQAYMEIFQANNARLIYIVAKTEDAMRCCCVRVDEEISISYEDDGDYFTRDGVLVTKQLALNSRRGYEVREVYDALSGRMREERIGFFSKDPIATETAQDVCLDLLDAVRFGMEREVNSLLGGGLSGLGISDMREFFGDFDFYAFPPAYVSEGILLGIGKESELCEMKLFRFDAVQEDSDQWKIVNVTEL